MFKIVDLEMDGFDDCMALVWESRKIGHAAAADDNEGGAHYPDKRPEEWKGIGKLYSRSKSNCPGIKYPRKGVAKWFVRCYDIRAQQIVLYPFNLFGRCNVEEGLHQIRFFKKESAAKEFAAKHDKLDKMFRCIDRKR